MASMMASQEQLEALYNFFEEHRELASGKYRSVEGRATAKRLWAELSSTLNSMGGCTKSVQQWQKVWADKKFLAKKAATQHRRSPSVIGDGQKLPPLSNWEKKVLKIMGYRFSGRHSRPRLPSNDKTIKEEDSPSNSRQPSPSISLPSPTMSDEDPISLASDSQQALKVNEIHTASECDVSRRLLQIEEERKGREIVRNNELAGIRKALVEMCGLMKEFINKNDNEF